MFTKTELLANLLSILHTFKVINYVIDDNITVLDAPFKTLNYQLRLQNTYSYIVIESSRLSKENRPARNT